MSSSRERGVTEAFVDLADTLVAHYDVIDLLYRLAESCVELLGADAAGLLLSDQRGNLTPLAATEGSRVLELIQLQSEQGPCLDCFRTSAPVSCPDLATHGGPVWPAFTAAARRAGYAAVYALPLRLREETIGALSLMTATPGPLPDADLRLGQALADVATIGILHERAVRRGEVLAEQLQNALSDRIIIEQAKGVLAAHGRIDTELAFARLRGHARANHLRLTDLAQDVVTGRIAVEPLLRDRSTP